MQYIEQNFQNCGLGDLLILLHVVNNTFGASASHFQPSTEPAVDKSDEDDLASSSDEEHPNAERTTAKESTDSKEAVEAYMPNKNGYIRMKVLKSLQG